ncbi:MAG: glycosyltransferase family 39 protein [Longimicrobiales bacterium]
MYTDPVVAEPRRTPVAAATSPARASAYGPGSGGRPPSRLLVRLFLTVWLVYGLHLATNVVRETYLAVSLGTSLSVRVDDFIGLHPDLFVIEGRGGYINNNPGASLLAAVPYALARPAIDVLFRLRPALGAPKPPATYEDPRPNRTRFMNEARARGLDVRLGLAAITMQLGLMAPLGALAAVLLFVFLRERLGSESQALWLTLLYAFGTPIFFRSAFLNQNALLAHFTLFAYLLVASARGLSPPRLAAAGALLGLGLLCDYSAAPLLLAFGGWILIEAYRRQHGAAATLRRVGAFCLGAAIPVALLLGYQWLAFGNPWFPAQSYMPPTALSGSGWNGLFWPIPELLWRNLFDPRYGLLVFCPMLAAALLAPALRLRPGGPTHSELALIFAAAAALYLFSSSVQFALLQFNTGVRYLVPAVPLLFIALVPVLLAAPAWLRWLLVIPSVTISWAVSMAREDVPTALARVFMQGFELPVLTVLQKMSSGYLPQLEQGVSPVPLFVLAGVVLWLLWRGTTLRDAPAESKP